MLAKLGKPRPTHHIQVFVSEPSARIVGRIVEIGRKEDRSERSPVGPVQLLREYLRKPFVYVSQQLILRRVGSSEPEGDNICIATHRRNETPDGWKSVRKRAYS